MLHFKRHIKFLIEFVEKKALIRIATNLFYPIYSQYLFMYVYSSLITYIEQYN